MTRAKKPADSREPVGHPYGRISDPEQRKGGGLARQSGADFGAFCRLHGLVLNPRLRIDDGVSAFHGLNASPEHELGQFLADAERGDIPPGDCLIIENWDRLSRQNVWAAIGLVNDLRQLGIHVGRLDRMKLLRCDSTDVGDFFEAAIELMRGNSESAAKSDRNGAMWEKKREAARNGKPQPQTKRMGSDARVLTRKLPAWLRVEGSRVVAIPERAAVVVRIFELRAAGYGYPGIVAKLREDDVPPFCGRVPVLDGEGQPVLHKKGRRKGKPRYRAADGKVYGADRWTVPYVVNILTNREALGEYQPRGKGREPIGEPIPGYYPRVIEDALYYEAQAGGQTHGKYASSRRGKHLDVFAGLLTDARSGSAYMVGQKGKGVPRVLFTHASTEGRGSAWSFPAGVFEQAALTLLREIDPAEVIGGGATDERKALEAEEAALKASIAAINADMDEHGESPALFGRMRSKESRLREVVGLLEAARARAAHPAADAWDSAQSLAGLLADAENPADMRLRLRAAIRRVVADVRLIVVPRGRDRLCAAQMWFEDSRVSRSYLILHRAAGRGRDGGWWAASLSREGGDAVGGLDLRSADHVAEVERQVLDVDVEDFITRCEEDGTPSGPRKGCPPAIG